MGLLCQRLYCILIRDNSWVVVGHLLLSPTDAKKIKLCVKGRPSRRLCSSFSPEVASLILSGGAEDAVQQGRVTAAQGASGGAPTIP